MGEAGVCCVDRGSRSCCLGRPRSSETLKDDHCNAISKVDKITV